MTPRFSGETILPMAKSDWRTGRIFFWWCILSACWVALIQAAGSMSGPSVIILAICGAAFGTFAVVEHRLVRLWTVSSVISICLFMCGTAYFVWPAKRTPETANRLIDPTVNWSDQDAISFGTPLSSKQLDASANVLGSYTYNPTVGTVLPIGTNTLSLTFYPTDQQKYSVQARRVTIVVLPDAQAKPLAAGSTTQRRPKSRPVPSPTQPEPIASVPSGGSTPGSEQKQPCESSGTISDAQISNVGKGGTGISIIRPCKETYINKPQCKDIDGTCIYAGPPPTSNVPWQSPPH